MRLAVASCRYKGSFLHSTAQLEVSICGQHKSSSAAKGSRPIFSETLEFLLGGALRLYILKKSFLHPWTLSFHDPHIPRNTCTWVYQEVPASIWSITVEFKIEDLQCQECRYAVRLQVAKEMR